VGGGAVPVTVVVTPGGTDVGGTDEEDLNNTYTSSWTRSPIRASVSNDY